MRSTIRDQRAPQNLFCKVHSQGLSECHQMHTGHRQAGRRMWYQILHCLYWSWSTVTPSQLIDNKTSKRSSLLTWRVQCNRVYQCHQILFWIFPFAAKDNKKNEQYLRYYVYTTVVEQKLDQYTMSLLILNTVHCKLFKVEKFCGFCGSIGNRETIPVKSIGFSHTRLPINCERFPANYNLFL